MTRVCIYESIFDTRFGAGKAGHAVPYHGRDLNHNF